LPEETLLYRIAAKHYPDLLRQLAAEGRTLPRYVEREFDDYLKSGRLEHGFLRVRCDHMLFPDGVYVTDSDPPQLRPVAAQAHHRAKP
jgi:hypothetical protein